MKWPTTLSAAAELQIRNLKHLRITSLGREIRYIAGVDAAFAGDFVFGAACLYRLPERTLVEYATSTHPASFPYVPGYLFFREGPALATALRKLTVRPDVILVDGQGIAHPRGIGSASHLGVLLGFPTIGCAKSRLIGEHKEPGPLRGDWSPLQYDGATIGAALRTRDRVRPLYVSPGHLIDLADAIRITLACCERYRIPEPLRCADMASRALLAKRR